MKKFTCIIAMAFVVMVSGCSSSYKRDTDAGQVINITVKQMEDKLAKKDSFALVFTQTTCQHCIDFKAMLDGYLLNHNVTLYDVVLDEAPQSEQQKNLDTIRKTFALTGTPALYYVKEGKLENTFDMGNDGITQDKFDAWVQKFKLDAKK